MCGRPPDRAHVQNAAHAVAPAGRPRPKQRIASCLQCPVRLLQPRPHLQFANLQVDQAHLDHKTAPATHQWGGDAAGLCKQGCNKRLAGIRWPVVALWRAAQVAQRKHGSHTQAANVFIS